MGRTPAIIALIVMGFYHIIGVVFDCDWFWKGYKKQDSIRCHGKRSSQISYFICGVSLIIFGIVLVFYKD